MGEGAALTILLLAVAGSLGAGARYVVSSVVERRSRSRMPLGTTVVNLLGAFLLGCVLGVGSSSPLSTGATGVLGGFTSFSTWMAEVDALGASTRTSWKAMVHLVAPMVLGVLAAALGYHLMGSVLGS